MPHLMTKTRARIEKFVGDSRTHFWRREKSDPNFPKTLTLGGRDYLVVEELDEYITSLIAERDANTNKETL